MPNPVAGSLIGPAVTIARDSYTAAKPQYDYVKDIGENFEKLKSAITSLNAVKRDVEDDLKKEANTKIMTHDCRLWLDRVGKISESFTELQEKYQRTNSYMFGLCPFFELRKLGKGIVKLTKEVTTRSEDMANLRRTNKVMVERYLKEVECPNDVLELKSQTDEVNKLLGKLRDATVKKIGFHGLEGIGKTTIMEKLHKKVVKKSEFRMTFIISVSGEDSSRKVQGDLVRQLGLPITDTHSSEQLADIISKEIENVKYLLLLDQVSSAISLDAIGIRDYHKYGKVVIASSKRQICKEMGADEFLKVEQMPLEDAYILFDTIVGLKVKSRRIATMTIQIVKNLIRLPRAIILAAKNLKGENEEYKWEVMLQNLNNPINNEQHNLEDLNKMFTNLFNQLSFISRRCLFYASLFPSEYKIHKDYLVECWINEGFISHDSSESFRNRRMYGLGNLNDLMEASLLEKCRSRRKYIIVPEQIRKLSLQAIDQVDESEPLVMTRQKKPENNWKHAVRISLICNHFSIFPQSPTNCSRTRTLLLQKNLELKHISKSFFAHMCELKVLDLYAVGINSLPKSIFDLIKLQSLYLNHCKQLTSLSSEIEKLKDLRLLDIRDTGISSLPKAIGELSELKCFRVSLLNNGAERLSKNPIKNLFKRKKVLIPKNMIKKLSKLEELTIIIDPKESSWNEIVGNIVEEIASLEMLTTLYFNFPGVDSLAAFITTSKSWNQETEEWGGITFRSYKMLVGSSEANEHQNLYHSERLLRFCSGKDFPSEIKTVLQQTSAFELIGHNNVQSLAEFGVEYLRYLEVCVIETCNKMESVIDCYPGIDGQVFPALKRLHISNLPQLDRICKGEMIEGSMVNLTTLVLKGCPKLSSIFTPELAQKLQKLKRLRIENCSGVVFIIVSETNSHFSADGESENISPLAENDNGDNPLMFEAQSCTVAESSGAKVSSLPLISNGAGNHSETPEINENQNPSEDLEKNEAKDEKIIAENQFKVCDDIVSKKGSRVPDNIDLVGEKIIAQNQPWVGEIIEAENHSGTSKISEARNNSRISKIIKFEHEIVTPNQSMNGKTIKVETHSRINDIFEAQSHLRVSEIEEVENEMIVTHNQSRIDEIIEAQKHLRVSEIVEEETNSHRGEIVNIVGTVNIENLAGALPKLESLELVDLPLLRDICQSHVLSLLALDNIEIHKCPNFKNISSITMNSDELCSIGCSNSFWEAQVWPDDHLRQRLQPLCRFFKDESPNDPSSSSVVASSPTS